MIPDSDSVEGLVQSLLRYQMSLVSDRISLVWDRHHFGVQLLGPKSADQTPTLSTKLPNKQEGGQNKTFKAST